MKDLWDKAMHQLIAEGWVLPSEEQIMERAEKLRKELVQ